MKAVGYAQSLEINQPLALEDIELPKPEPQDNDVLVRVNAISVNPVDTKVRRRANPDNGSYKVLGWDAVGEVVAVGAASSLYDVGDRVWYAGDLMRSGTNAEYHLVDERIIGKAPVTLSDAEAAALPLTAITAWELLFDRLEFKTRDEGGEADNAVLLVVGAAGGVGSILLQLASKLTDVTVIATASRRESQAWVKTLGAHHVINHYKPLQEQLNGLGVAAVTHVISLNHTEQHFEQIVEVLAPQGKLALIDDPQALDIKKLKQKSISLHWEFMFTRAMFQTHDMAEQGNLLNALSRHIDSGVIKTTVAHHYGAINADNLKRAHMDIENGATIGKIVLQGF